MDTTEKKIQSKTSNKKFLSKFIPIIIFLLLLSALVGYLKYQQSKALENNPIFKNQTEGKELLDKIGAIAVLPDNEFPSIATVSDVSQLKKYPFFKNAKNGDKVLIYTKANLAILYDPVKNKIIMESSTSTK